MVDIVDLSIDYYNNCSGKRLWSILFFKNYIMIIFQQMERHHEEVVALLKMVLAHAAYRMLVPSQKFCVVTLIPTVKVFGAGAFGRYT